MLIGELFGTSDHHRFVKSISSSGKFIYIDFYKYYYGVEFVASIKYKKIDQECQSWLSNNKLISPNSPKINCSWIITRKFGSYITIDFNFIEVKPIHIAVIINSNYILLTIDWEWIWFLKNLWWRQQIFWFDQINDRHIQKY